MKVKELIKELQQHDKDAEVYVTTVENYSYLKKVNDMTNKTLRCIQSLLDKVSDGIEEYACTLESTDVIRDPLDEIYDIIEKELIKSKTE